jgi:hypothetical protein
VAHLALARLEGPVRDGSADLAIEKLCKAAMRRERRHGAARCSRWQEVGDSMRGGALKWRLAAVFLGACGPKTVPPSNPAPTLTSISPSSPPREGPSFTLTVNGSNFVSGSSVRWNGDSRPTTYISSTQLTAQIGITDILVAGTSSVTVFNPPPNGGTSNSVTFDIPCVLAPPGPAPPRVALASAHTISTAGPDR